MTILGHRVLIEPEEAIKQTASGLYIPETAQKPRNTGKVIAVGTEADQSLLNKKVMFQPQAAQTLDFDNVSGRLIFETDIIAIL